MEKAILTGGFFYIKKSVPQTKHALIFRLYDIIQIPNENYSSAKYLMVLTIWLV